MTVTIRRPSGLKAAQRTPSVKPARLVSFLPLATSHTRTGANRTLAPLESLSTGMPGLLSPSGCFRPAGNASSASRQNCRRRRRAIDGRLTEFRVPHGAEDLILVNRVPRRVFHRREEWQAVQRCKNTRLGGSFFNPRSSFRVWSNLPVSLSQMRTDRSPPTAPVTSARRPNVVIT